MRRSSKGAILRTVRVYVSQCLDPFVNLSIEDYLFRSRFDLKARSSHVSSYGAIEPLPILFLYRNSPCVVIGRHQNPWRECCLKTMRDRGVVLVRRRSGGGAVYHDTGNTNYSVMTSRPEFDKSKVSDWVVATLRQTFHLPASYRERHDVWVNARKVSGSAFKIASAGAYHHGTMLIRANLANLEACLLSKNTMAIEGRGTDSIRSVVTNLCELEPRIDHDRLCQALCTTFARVYGDVTTHSIDRSDVDQDALFVQSLEEIKSPGWIYGQTPDFSVSIDKDLETGPLQILGLVKDGIIQDLRVTIADRAYDAVIEHWTRSLLGRYFEYDSVKRTTEMCVAQQVDDRKRMLTLIADQLLDHV